MKFKFHLNLTRITDTSYEEMYAFVIISRLVLLGRGNVSDKSRRENQTTYFVSNKFFQKIAPLWYNRGKMAESERPLVTAQCSTVKTSLGFRVTKARIQTHTQNMQQLLLFHSNNGCTNAPHCYLIRKLPALLKHHTSNNNVTVLSLVTGEPVVSQPAELKLAQVNISCYGPFPSLSYG